MKILLRSSKHHQICVFTVLAHKWMLSLGLKPYFLKMNILFNHTLLLRIFTNRILEEEYQDLGLQGLCRKVFWVLGPGHAQGPWLWEPPSPQLSWQ